MRNRRRSFGLLPLGAALLLLGTPGLASQRDETTATRQVSGTSSHSASSTRSSASSTSRSSGSSSSRSAPSSSSSSTAHRSSATASSTRQREGRSAWHHQPRHYPSRHYYGGYNWGFNYYPNYWGYWYTPWFWGPSVNVIYDNGPGVVRGSSYRDVGALDTDISPEKAEIYIDGKYVGIADDFDGFPAYLWLEEGTYDVAAYMPGYKTLSRQVSVYPGLVIDLDHRLEPGEAVRPEDLAPKETPIADERVRRDQERREEAEWRRGDDVQPPVAGAAAGLPESADSNGRLMLDVVPDDAAIYLDGRFLGTAEEVRGLHAGLIVEPGEHQLSAVRPGFGEKRRRFTLEPGEELLLSLDLDD